MTAVSRASGVWGVRPDFRNWVALLTERLIGVRAPPNFPTPPAWITPGRRREHRDPGDEGTERLPAADAAKESGE